MEQLGTRYDGDVPGPLVLMTGMCSSTVAQLVSFPLALVRTRLQVCKTTVLSLPNQSLLSLRRKQLILE